MTIYRSYIQLGGAVLLLIIVLGAYLFWYAQVNAESVKIGTIEAEIQVKTQTSARIELIKSQLNDLNSNEAAINQYFVSTNDVVPYLEGLQATGKYFKSTVNVVSVSATPGSPYGNLDLALSITGSFNAVVSTLGAIEYEPYDTTINSLTLDTTPASGTANSSSIPEWTATADFSIGTASNTTSIAPIPVSASTSSTESSNQSTTTVNISSTSPSASPPVAGPSATI